EVAESVTVAVRDTREQVLVSGFDYGHRRHRCRSGGARQARSQLESDFHLHSYLRIGGPGRILVRRICSGVMTTLAYNSQELTPRELRPGLYELDGISRETIDAHYKLYQGYVNKRNELLGKLAEVDVSAANQVYSEVRALKVDLSFALGGIKNHEFYFEHLGGHGGDPDGPVSDLIRRDFGSAEGWRADLKATGMGARGWAWTAYDWDERR